ncbi:MAG: nucleotidyltransferase family protein [Pseudomonadota bacterium]
MHSTIAAKLDDIVRLCREHGVKRLEIFGSAARGDDFDPERSDADFLVEFNSISRDDPFGQVFRFEDSLTALLGREVDLIEGLTVRNPYLQKAIDRDRQVLYVA